MTPLHVLTPLGMLGYGYPAESFAAGLAYDPAVIACDAGSTDAGPHKLGSGVGIVSRAATRRDLAPMLDAARARGIPLIVGSSGGSGAAPHLAWTADIVAEILREMGWSARVALIHADVDAERVVAQLRAGTLRPLRSVPDVGEAEIRACGSIVAQMGAEPIVRALEAGAEVVLCGRAYDPAVIAALPILRGYDTGLALHMGKVLECGAQCAVPGAASDCMIGAIDGDGFTLTPASQERACTPITVAAHTLYEKSDPSHLPGPGGDLDLREARFTPVDARTVRVEGSRFVPSDAYTVKLEGASLVGYRSIAIAGIRDPIMIRALDECLDHVEGRVRAVQPQARIRFVCYGRDGVLGASEPVATTAHEIGLVIEALAETQDEAAAACSLARSSLLHYHYHGRKGTSGNLAFPFAPSDFQGGAVYRFTLYHTIPLADPCEPFPLSWMQ